MRFNLFFKPFFYLLVLSMVCVLCLSAFAQKENSVKYWQQSVEKNPAFAKGWFNLGILFESGQGVKADSRVAERYYHKAIKLGYAPAMYNLGSIYAQQKDYVKAREWWEKAAELNIPEAQYNMGMIYEKGLGVSANPQLSASWYQRAAETALKKYLQLYHQSRSQLQHLSSAGENSISRSILDDFQIIKTASAANLSTPEIALDQQPTQSTQLAQAQTDQAVSNSNGKKNAWPWIHSQPKDNFTIQLFASKEENKTEKFIQQYALTDRAKIITAIVKGVTYHKVILGSFVEWNDAAVEIGSFPQDLRDQRPWVRKFSTLYKEMPEGTSTEVSAVQGQTVQSEDASAAEKSLESDSDNSESAQAEITTQVQTEETQSQESQPEQTQTLEEQSESETQSQTDDSQDTEKKTESDPQSPVKEEAMLEQSGEGEQVESSNGESESQDMSNTLSGDVFTPYAKQQLASTSLSENIKSQLQAGLEAIEAENHQNAYDQLSGLADSGLPEAQYQIALLFSQGKGVDRDDVKAFELMKLAAEQGHPYAQQSLANFYAKGIGVEANPSLSAYWNQTAQDNISRFEPQ